MYKLADTKLTGKEKSMTVFNTNMYVLRLEYTYFQSLIVTTSL